MDGDAVEAEPSQLTLTEFFIQMFPVYMSMGMSYDEYWNGPSWLAKSYREAHEMKRKQEEWARHRQGAYFMQALRVALSGFSKDKTHPEKYPDKPWPISEKDAREHEAEKERANFKKFVAKINADSMKKQEVNDVGDD